MTRIKQLSPQEAQKIAAGEVVERPANVVKELVENALDAGATAISIYIEDAGKSLIRIVDNGCGMSPEDAHLCFKHHATSKITRVDDLPTLSTFGFRGEALSSISAVSNVTLITKEAHVPQGTKLVLDQGLVITQESISANSGTDISIANLFFNVPARKKFLKTNDTESRQIMLLFQAFCLDYLSVHFKLFTQGTLHYNCPPATETQQRVAQLWDHTVAQQTVPVHAEKNGIKIEGVISNHTYSRYDRSAIYFFVNRRRVKNHALAKALLKGYMNVLQPDKFPLACIHIHIDPAQVDINIHPRKEEVQFLHPRILEQFLYETIKSRLEEFLSAQLQKKVSFNHPEADFKTFTPVHQSLPARPYPVNALQPVNLPRDLQANESFIPARVNFAPPPTSTHSHAPQEPLPINSDSPVINNQHHEYQIIGQFKKTYIIIEHNESLFLVDQHAAHERILYELFATRFQEVATISLLFPQIITLKEEDLALIEDHLAIFKANHICLERTGTEQLIVQAIPVHLKEVNIEELVLQTIGWIREYHKLDPEQWYKKVHEKLHAQMACKAAVKAGDQLTILQMQQLLTDLEKTPNRLTCPHGRPTGWILPLYEIEKKFKRKL